MEKKYKQELSHYEINVYPTDMERWRRSLQDNQPLTPEIVGMLLGRAEPIWIDVACDICHEKIEEGAELKYRVGDFGWRYKNAHQTCYDKVKQEFDESLR